MNSDGVGEHFDGVAPDYDRWKAKAHHYYSALKASLAEVVPAGSRVLEVGCATGDILASLDPAEGVGIDISPAMIELASLKHPGLRFLVHDLMKGPIDERFDYVVAADVAEHVPDLEVCMRAMAGMLTDRGVLVLVTANPAWGPVLHLAELLHMKMPEGDHEWRSRTDIVTAAIGARLRERSFTRSLLVPRDLFGVRGLDSARWAYGIRQRFGLIQRAVFDAAPGAHAPTPGSSG
ncbi:MAG: class I SAM-dependent methyltransferase [Actinobacteria bacterium]|nr:MAG: class I SAM-dependent methyltransferase [Actinomycetota bacterium]